MFHSSSMQNVSAPVESSLMRLLTAGSVIVVPDEVDQEKIGVYQHPITLVRINFSAGILWKRHATWTVRLPYP